MRLEEFFSGVQVRTGAVGRPVLEDCARRAIKTFFRHSDCWRKSIGASVVSTGSAEFRLNSVGPEMVNNILSVRPRGRKNLEIKSEAAMDEINPGWREEKAQNPLRCVRMRDGSIVLHPAPELAQDLIVEVSLCPGRETNEIPDEIGERWFDQIVDGIVGEVSDIPGKPYSDTARAQAGKKRLLDAARDARVRANKSGMREVSVARLTSFEEL